MADLENPVVVPATGYVYVAEPNTDMPDLATLTDPTTPPAGWTDIGNTSLENGLEHAVEGDDPTTLGSWQRPTLITTSPNKSYAVTINLEDFTVQSYQLYYGSNTAAATDGTFTLPLTPTPQLKALLVIATDGRDMVVEYYPNTSIIGADAITYDPAALSEIPIKCTILAGDSTHNWPGKISPKMAIPKAPPPAPDGGTKKS